MQDMILNIMGQYGYIGVFLLIMIENIFPPIPSEVILLFGGFMTTYTLLNLPGMVVASTLGSLFGAILLYMIGMIFDQARLYKIVTSKAGRLLCLKTTDIDKANNWFDRNGVKTVFFCRFIPLIRSLISIPAGMNKMNMFSFLIYTTVGSLIWNFVLILIGSIVGENWGSILNIMDTYSHITVIVLALLFGVFIIMFYKHRLGERRK